MSSNLRFFFLICEARFFYSMFPRRVQCMHSMFCEPPSVPFELAVKDGDGDGVSDVLTRAES